MELHIFCLVRSIAHSSVAVSGHIQPSIMGWYENIETPGYCSTECPQASTSYNVQLMPSYYCWVVYGWFWVAHPIGTEKQKKRPIKCKLYHNVTKHRKFDWPVCFFFFSFMGQTAWIDCTGFWKVVVVNGIRLTTQPWTLNPLLTSHCAPQARSKFKGESWVD